VLAFIRNDKVVYPAGQEVVATPARGSQSPPTKEESNRQFVEIDFDDVDILVFVKFVSEATGKNFVVDPKVKGKVNIVSSEKMPVDEVYKVFQSVLEVHGYTTVEAGSIIKIVPSSEARGKAVETHFLR
jgi:general secretion pathway protein D